MKISFHGAARTVTGSKHLIETNLGKRILLDCGLFQGMGRETLDLNSHFGFNSKEIDFVILSHAHIDHSGLLPKLIKEGFKGNIYCTPPTKDLCSLLLPDSGRIQENDIIYINKLKSKLGKATISPIYTEDDALKVLNQMVEIPYHTRYSIDKNISFEFTDAGHIIGSASVHIDIVEDNKTHKITFSGDIGRFRDMLLRSPEAFRQADHIILESTYGCELHNSQKPNVDTLYDFIYETCILKKGKLLIPAFSVGRTQELLYLLNQLEMENRLPPVKYFVDSPLSTEVTQLFKENIHEFNDKIQNVLKSDDDIFNFKGLQLISSIEDSKKLNVNQEPCVILSASGMAEAGRIKHHIANNIQNKQNTILVAGFCESNSLGAKLSRGDKQVSIFGEMYEVLADIRKISSISAHGDRDDLLQYLKCQDPNQVQKIFLVHGEYEKQIDFRELLQEKKYASVEIPKLHEEFQIL